MMVRRGSVLLPSETHRAGGSFPPSVGPLVGANTRAGVLRCGRPLGNRTFVKVSAPARELPEHAERRLADDLVHQHRVGRVDRAGADVAVDALELAAPEEGAAATDVECAIDDLLGGLDGG